VRSAKLLHRSQTANDVAVTFWSLPASRLLAGLCPTIEAPGSTGASSRSSPATRRDAGRDGPGAQRRRPGLGGPRAKGEQRVSLIEILSLVLFVEIPLVWGYGLVRSRR
jgi:hypothetical protein